MVPHPPLIIPEVGKGREEEVRQTIDAYQKAAAFVAALEPETIVVSSPHSVMYLDYIHISPGEEAWGSFAQFRAGMTMVRAEYDTQLRDRICDLAQEEDIPAGTLGEKDAHLDHGTMIPLYFINQVYEKKYRIIRLGISGLSFAQHYRLGQVIARAAQETGRRVVYVASGDLSHKLKESGPYGFDPAGPRYDERIMDVMGSGRFDELLDFDENFCDQAAECGHRSFVLMAGALDGCALDIHRLSHQDVTGVGYGICTYAVRGQDESRHLLARWESRQRARIDEERAKEDPYVKLARQSVESWVGRRKKLPVPEGLPQEMLSRSAGVFVSIHEEGRLRGCIGTISAVQENIAREIIENAISASTRDPRFSKIVPSELERLEYSVDVLGEVERIDSPDQLDVRRYGVIVSRDGRRGLLLPNLDGVDTVEKQIRIAKEKAGIGRYERDVQLSRFEVVRHF